MKTICQVAALALGLFPQAVSAGELLPAGYVPDH